ncbi:MAG: CPBP family glutamic-type intramembrane protease [Gemmatimonadota bacterium]
MINPQPAVDPRLRVLLAVVVYIVVALMASALIKRFGFDHKDMSGRTSPPVVVIGALANIVISALVLLMLVTLDHRSPTELGLRFSAKDAIAVASSLAVMAVGAALFLTMLQLRGRIRIRWMGTSAAGAVGLTTVTAVLFAVALQEELLYRGYISLNLLRFGPTTAVATSVVAFTAIHLLTNRAGAAQIVSWLLGGATLVGAYLLSGSLWVAVVVHLAMDVTNVVAFGIAGSHSWVELQPALSSEQRTVYRLLTSVALIVLFLGLYGASIKLA